MANVQTECKSHCDSEDHCKGYDFSIDYLECAFYTVSSCPAECKKNEGDAGDLTNSPDVFGEFSGCYIKLGTCTVNQFYIGVYWNEFIFSTAPIYSFKET